MEKEIEEGREKARFKSEREKCCLIIGALVIKGASPQNNEEEAKVLAIFNAHKNFNGRIEVAKLEELRANMENSPYTKMHGYSSVQKLTPNSVEPIYSEVDDCKVSSSLEELSTSKESLYAKIDDLRNENSSLEPIHVEVDYSEISNLLGEKEQKKPAQKEAVENIYATVDLEQKRRDRKI